MSLLARSTPIIGPAEGIAILAGPFLGALGCGLIFRMGMRLRNEGWRPPRPLEWIIGFVGAMLALYGWVTLVYLLTQ
jgi:hypothetical protein